LTKVNYKIKLFLSKKKKNDDKASFLEGGVALKVETRELTRKKKLGSFHRVFVLD
jgi:hypothetical protein